MEGQIEHVSDTALMVAACRAIETEREDGQVHDPFAERLAGERGMVMARSGPFLELVSFVVGVRARLMDELILELAGAGQIETVVNLGAGLDTRPWRLDLPPALRWIETDFKDILEYKYRRLGSETPRCRLQRLRADLADSDARFRVFEEVGPGPALMITEGLLMYLSKVVFTAIATEAPRFSGIQHWLLDAASMDAWRRMTGGDSKSTLEHLRPADHLQGQTLLHGARESGWDIAVTRLYTRELAAMSQARIAKLTEALKHAGNPAPPPDELSGVYLLNRAAEHR